MTGLNFVRIATVLIRRKRRASALGISFRRAGSFAVPDRIELAGKSLTLSLPYDNGTKAAFIDLLLDDTYQLARLPRKMNRVVDIGGHAGLFALAARQRWPEARIHSYEPNPAMSPFYEHHAAQADFTVFPEAVGDVPGLVNIEATEESVQVRSKPDAAGTIQQTAFAEVIRRIGGTVDLLKLDCEGAEWSILRDYESLRAVGHITMEFHLWAGYSSADIRSRILDLGFRIWHFEMTGANFGILAASRP